MDTLNPIKKALNEYVKLEAPEFAVMLTGKWGSGKTFFIKRCMEEWEKSIFSNPNPLISIKSLKDADIDTVVESIFHPKPIYISLNGVEKLSQISQKLKQELFPLLYSQNSEIVKKLIAKVINYKTGIEIQNEKQYRLDDIFDMFGGDFIAKNLFSYGNFAGKGIIVFDDIERCDIESKILFGYLSNILENAKCKIILVCNEDKIADQKYNEIKEKLVGRTYLLEPNLTDIIDQFIIDRKNPIFKQHSNLISNLFQCSGYNNLRTIKRCFDDYEILFQIIESYVNAKYNPVYIHIFKANVLAYFIICYCEFKAGDTNFDKHYELNHLQLQMIEQNKNKDLVEKNKQILIKENEYNKKYNPILKFFKIQESAASIDIKYIVEYLKNGYISNIYNILENSPILNYTGPSLIDELWELWNLSDIQFIPKIENLKTLFFNNKISKITEICKASTILYVLSKKEIITTDIKSIFPTAKRHITSILNSDINYKKVLKDYDSFKINLCNNYLDIEDNDLTEYINWIHSELKNYFINNRINLLNRYLENISNKNYDIFKILLEERVSPFDETIIECTSLFCDVDIKNCAANILKLNNPNKLDFTHFIANRYKPVANIDSRIPPYAKAEYQPIRDLTDILKEKISGLKYTEKYLLQFLVETLEKASIQIKKAIKA